MIGFDFNIKLLMLVYVDEQVCDDLHGWGVFIDDNKIKILHHAGNRMFTIDALSSGLRVDYGVSEPPDRYSLSEEFEFEEIEKAKDLIVELMMLSPEEMIKKHFDKLTKE